MSTILVVNSGSSSFKYQLIEMETESVLATGLIERIGEAVGHSKHKTEKGSAELNVPIVDHAQGFQVMLDAFETNGPSLSENAPVAVGHRVVQGGSVFSGPTLVTDEIEAAIQDLADLAPLHNPANLAGIKAAQKAFPGVPHVVVFDTAFHQTLPPAAYTYAIDAKLAEEHRIRRYGAHGTSHKFVAAATAEFLGRPIEDTKTIVLHLGNGASACAVDGGRSVEVSMGLTPLEGLVMGSRSGDIDPAVLFHLSRKAGLTIDELDVLLNKQSGIFGLTGARDMRDVADAAENGDAVSLAALDVYMHRIKHYVGGYYAQLGRVDAIAFTAGVGENDPILRAGVLADLEELGIEIDPERNNPRQPGVRRISTDASRVAVLVVPTNEELEIARQTLSII